jgi:membrane-bound lytic murein transglycosylase D
VDLRLVAECVDATPAQLQELNPSLLRMTTPREGTFELHLPAGKKEQYQTAIAAVPKDMRLWWRYHKVQPGDTLASLGRSYRVTAKAIAETNRLEGSELEAGSNVVIPIAAGKHPLSDAASYARRITRYKVRRGDTVETVAENFGVSAQMVRRWNGIRGDSLRGRKVLALHLPVTPNSETVSTASHKSSAAAHKTTLATGAKAPARRAAKSDDEDSSEQASVLTHKVKSGETLYSIAMTYKTTVAALKRNNANVATLKPGMILVVQPNP